MYLTIQAASRPSLSCKQKGLSMDDREERLGVGWGGAHGRDPLQGPAPPLPPIRSGSPQLDVSPLNLC